MTRATVKSQAAELTRIPAVARQQAGLFTRAQARAEGWSDDQIRHRLRAGSWVRSIGRALMRNGHPNAPHTLAWAVHLTLPSAVISHLTAGLLFGFPVTQQSRLAHAYSDQHHKIDGIVRHQLPLSATDRTITQRLPVTTRTRTAFDCLALLPPDRGINLWAWLSSRRILSTDQLAQAVRDRLGWPGTPNLLSILTVAQGGAGSVAEQRLHHLLRSAGIGGWAAGVTIHDGSGLVIAVADILFHRERLIIEVDGFASHAGLDAFVNDRRRQNALVNAGYRVLRVTWLDLTKRPAELIAEIRAALAQ